MKKIFIFIDKYILIIFIVTIIVSLATFLVLTLLGYRFVIPDYRTVPDFQVINGLISWIFPTILSLIAIFISIETTRKQNKIALFEKRYDIYVEIANYCTLGKSMQTQYEFLLENIDDVQAKDCFDECQYIDYALNDFLSKTKHPISKVNIRFSDQYIDERYRASIISYFDEQKNLVDKICMLFGEKESKAFEKYLNNVILIFKCDGYLDIVEQIKSNAQESNVYAEKHLKKMKNKLMLIEE